MNEKQIQSILRELAEQKAPKAEIDLWPAIDLRLEKAHLQTSELTKRKETEMNTHQHHFPRQRLAAALVLIVIIASGLFFTTPQGQAMAQNILRFFSRSESNQLPIQGWQLTPLPPTAENPTADPASIIDADLSIEAVRQQAGFDIYEPSWVPDYLHFSGASIDRDRNIVRIFYRYVETNGLVLRQEPIPMTDTCELCGKVGADAAIQEVSIAGVYGEYAEGVWNLTDKGPVWDSNPYLKTIRWQKDGMAFEMLYMGPPDTLSKQEMIAIAESMK
jgi:hypothetical protein